MCVVHRSTVPATAMLLRRSDDTTDFFAMGAADVWPRVSTSNTAITTEVVLLFTVGLYPSPASWTYLPSKFKVEKLGLHIVLATNVEADAPAYQPVQWSSYDTVW